LLRLDANGFSPSTATQYDDLLVEFLHDTKITRSGFTTLLAAVEFVLPNLRRELRWSRTVLSSWRVLAPPKHTAPLPWIGGLLLASSFILVGRHSVAFGLLLAIRTGLRPGELLGLQAKDIQLTPRGTAVLALGAKRGTKVGRPQFVVVSNAFLVRQLRARKQALQPADYLVDIRYDAYRRLIAKAVKDRGWPYRFTPHSTRAGYVSESVVAGVDYHTIQKTGRWSSASSFQVYLDVVTSSAVGIDLLQYSEEAEYVAEHLDELLHVTTAKDVVSAGNAAAQEEADSSDADSDLSGRDGQAAEFDPRAAA